MTKKLQNPANTSVMLLAAGRGERMQELTKNCPKPLLMVGDISLIEHHLTRLATMGFQQIVINLAYLGEQLRDVLGNGERFSLRIVYSDESSTGALETAGGIQQALPLIKSDPFIVINADIWTDFDFTALLLSSAANSEQNSGCLVMVDNPQHNKKGDFYFASNGQLTAASQDSSKRLTFSGISLYRRSLFSSIKAGRSPLAPLLQEHIQRGKICAIYHPGAWTDVGTPERLELLNNSIQ